MSSSGTPDNEPTSDEELADFLAATAEVPQLLASDSELEQTLRDVAELRDEKKDLEAKLKIITAALKEKQGRILATFDARGITKIGIAGVGLFYSQGKPYPQVHDKPALIAWLDAHGEGAIAPRTPNFQTLRSWWASILARGAEVPPPEIATAFMDREIRFKKG
jgi:hypothetical protein